MSETTQYPSVLHIVEHEKFIPAFIELINREFNPGEHRFFFVHNGDRYTDQGPSKITRNTDFSSKIEFLVALAIQLNRAQKIILHGLFNSRLILLLFLQPWLLKKCYWIIWGGDLYTFAIGPATLRWRIKEFFRRPLIRNFGHLVTYLPGDVELARHWYGARGRYCECLVYPSNTFAPTELPAREHTGLHLLIGNSADRSNRHAGILDRLQSYADQPIHIYAPLSYGDADYADEVQADGVRRFGEKFVALRDFMPYSQYLELLASIDIAIFNHERQQGMGNIISLLGLGKTVYLNPRISTWKLLTGKGLHVGNIDEFRVQRFASADLQRNREIVEQEFSRERLIEQLRDLLES